MAERKCVLALGFFDGVHRGHAALLNRTIERAEALGVEGAVMTFDTHPDTLVQGTPVPLINSAPDRANLIRRLFGIDGAGAAAFLLNKTQTTYPACKPCCKQNKKRGNP